MEKVQEKKTMVGFFDKFRNLLQETGWWTGRTFGLIKQGFLAYIIKNMDFSANTHFS